MNVFECTLWIDSGVTVETTELQTFSGKTPMTISKEQSFGSLLATKESGAKEFPPVAQPKSTIRNVCNDGVFVNHVAT